MPTNTSDTSYGDADFVHDNLDSKLAGAPSLSFIDDIVALYRYFQHCPPAAHVGMIIFALAYFISPIDAVPDFIPVAGYLDDAAVVAGVVASIGSALDRFRS